MKRFDSWRQNVLLVKDDVGKPKPTTRRLPKGVFTFGKPEIRDAEDASKGKCPNNDSYSVTNSCICLVILQRQPAQSPRQRFQKT